MGASVHIKTAMIHKKVTQVQLAEKLGKATQTVYNTLGRDMMRYVEVERFADALGCDVVFRDRDTGEIY